MGMPKCNNDNKVECKHDRYRWTKTYQEEH
jgi:hypothetical protein